jgi:hypothetical protein
MESLHQEFLLICYYEKTRVSENSRKKVFDVIVLFDSLSFQALRMLPVEQRHFHQ